MKVRYDRHEDEWQAVVDDKSRHEVSQAWLRDDNLDYWRHARIKAVLKPLVKKNLSASWLTVGDGRYGSDAASLREFGATDVHASDISDTLLKEAEKLGHIHSFSEENAESLSFNDGAFDYVLCKEALHHFPRPYIALNEMFRVARFGVILIEPRDHSIDRAPLAWAVNLIKQFMGRGTKRHGFEPVGNYVYEISEREIEKFLLGMHFTEVAFRGINDSYVAGVERATHPPRTDVDKKLARKLKISIALQNALERLGVRRSGLLVALLFKEPPTEDLACALENEGFEFRRLPQNPHLEPAV